MTLPMDPYLSPVAQPVTTSRQQQQFKQIVIAWEKLRLLYNVVMLLTGVVALFVMVNYFRESTGTLITQVLFYGIAANLFFFAGPVCELYLRAFRNVTNAQTLRWILFITGTVFSLIPAGLMTISPMLFL